jgi:hypothetical protein
MTYDYDRVYETRPAALLLAGPILSLLLIMAANAAANFAERTMVRPLAIRPSSSNQQGQSTESRACKC